jgi:hypothetical protein
LLQESAMTQTVSAEVPAQLDGVVQPRVLSFGDQFSRWANLGISLA